ncbi:pickpocket protein 28-like [Sitodiplosis mosellana]|uniref:pickpocket protein 28-like n=1 Tax=Sitodiplosis mosellana TaxID=263140 RepID=UPI002444C3DE|nr:pickpocket protein 28-like [Sitodiplosis mosellana]
MASEMMNLNTNPNVSQWNRESGYKSIKSKAEYPIRLSELGGETALRIALRTNEDDFDYLCGGFEQEFRVFLSTPGDSLYGQTPLSVSIGEDSQMLISSKLTTTSDGLRRYAPHQRQCYYNSERPLTFFKQYSEQNCMAECMATYIKDKCGCVKFSMPRENSTRICGRDKLDCYRKNTLQFRLDRVVYSNSTCDCLPACISIEYNVEIDRVKFNTTAANKVSGLESGIHQTRLSISFNDRVETVKRVELYTFSDFLAICGGLLGLFLGISALSIIELVYYFTLRWFWIVRRSRTRNNL